MADQLFQWPLFGANPNKRYSGTLRQFDVVVPANDSDHEVPISIDVSELIACYFLMGPGENIAVFMNTRSPPGFNFALFPGVPYLWTRDMADWLAEPLGPDDITAILFDNGDDFDRQVYMSILTP